jgi:hypothetical protein
VCVCVCLYVCVCVLYMCAIHVICVCPYPSLRPDRAVAVGCRSIPVVILFKLNALFDPRVRAPISNWAVLDSVLWTAPVHGCIVQTAADHISGGPGSGTVNTDGCCFTGAGLRGRAVVKMPAAALWVWRPLQEKMCRDKSCTIWPLQS